MGSGHWDSDSYFTASTTRASKGIADFAYTKTATTTHALLDPKRINGKPFGKLESRDSADHPDSNAIMVIFDVTGSNIQRAQEAQKKLPNLMDLLTKYIPHPQVAIGANDDYKSVKSDAVQISDFESDNRIDEAIRNIRLVGQGGANDGESYDLLLYMAARKTVLDCWEKRGRKGYLFLYADEPFMTSVSKYEVNDTFGDSLSENIRIQSIIEEARRQYHVFVIWPRGGYDHARTKFIDLFGEESVLTLQDPNMICEIIASAVGLNEKSVTADDVAKDLVKTGVSAKDANSVVSTALATIGGSASLVVAGGASRL